MTREEAIKLLECSATELVGTMMQTDEQTAVNQIQRYVDAYDMAIAALREQDSNANQHVSNTPNALGGWISVADRLPEVGQRVLVCSLYDLQNIGWHLGDGRWQIKTAYPDTPTHWMPLPEAPKEEV